MGLSGYTIGTIISKVRGVTPRFSRDLIYGNIVVNFLFISGFIVFGVLTSAANQYFTVFTYVLVGLSILGIYFLLKLIITIVRSGRTDGEPAEYKDLKESNQYFSVLTTRLLFLFYLELLFL